MVSDKFRRQLRQEAKLWQAEELISPSLYAQLADRYQFDSLEKAASNRFVAILLGLGGILLGLGIITFVAANWQAWSREIKVTLLLFLFMSTNVTGFFLWRYPPQQWQHRLGQGLLLLGALILGANLGLISQMFHLGGPVYQLFLVWGLGVTAMAYGLRITSLGVMAVILVGIGYWSGANRLFYLQEFSWLGLMLEHIPLIAGLLFIPLAYWCYSSRVIFVLAALILIPALIYQMVALAVVGMPPAWITAIACLLPAALYWSYDDRLWPKVDSRSFQPPARAIAVFCLSLLFFICSFKWVSQELSYWRYAIQPDRENLWWKMLPWLLDIAFFTSLAFCQWWYLVRGHFQHSRRQKPDSASGAIACFLMVTLATIVLSSQVPATIVTYIFNVQLFVLAAGLMRVGLSRGVRGAFWSGIVLLVLQIISRMLEYNTALLLKSLVFILCGIGAIAAGLWFERHLSQLKPSEED